jgi:hypothetical protein
MLNRATRPLRGLALALAAIAVGAGSLAAQAVRRYHRYIDP